MEKSNRRIKLPRLVIIRADGLLPMLYTPREICEEMDVPDSTLRDWLQAGIPFERDNTQHLWINGEKFSTWVKEQQPPKKKSKLQDGEAYCMVCRRVTQITNPSTLPVMGKLVHIKGTCPHCGNIITRGGRLDRTPELPQN